MPAATNDVPLVAIVVVAVIVVLPRVATIVGPIILLRVFLPQLHLLLRLLILRHGFNIYCVNCSGNSSTVIS